MIEKIQKINKIKVYNHTTQINETRDVELKINYLENNKSVLILDISFNGLTNTKTKLMNGQKIVSAIVRN